MQERMFMACKETMKDTFWQMLDVNILPLEVVQRTVDSDLMPKYAFRSSLNKLCWLYLSPWVIDIYSHH